MSTSRKVRPTRAMRTKRFLEAKPDHIACKLYRAAEEAGVALSTVAEAGGVSRYSIYLWAAGDVEPSPARATIVRRLTVALQRAVKDGQLPVFDVDDNTAETKVAIIRRYL